MATFTSGSRRGWGCDSSALLDYYRRDFGAGVRVTERMASSSDRAAPSYPSHGFIFCSRAAALCTVNRLGSNRRLTSFQLIGIETGAPARARGDNTATAVAVRSFRK